MANSFLPSSTDSKSPISAGFYRLEKGTPLVYDYNYHEMKIIVDGEFDISDETGQKVHAVAGDVFYFPKGSKITFTTETFGLGFYCGQRYVVAIHFASEVGRERVGRVTGWKSYGMEIGAV